MAISLPRMERSSSPDNSPMSLPLNLMRPPTILPTLERSRITPSDTVDLPQPDSPTMPIACPGITVQEKSITAGISPRLVKNEIDRFSISRIGSAGFLTASFIGSSRAGCSISQRFLAQRIGQQVEAEHQRHQRQRRCHALPVEQAQLRNLAAVLDRRAPIGAFRPHAEAEEAQ